MISVVIPTFNYGHFVTEAIDSVLSQGIDDLEVIVCNDQSTDDTEARLAPYLSDPRIRYYRNEKNLGAVGNINYGMSLARGDYQLLIGADDFLAPGALQTLRATLQAHPECGYAYGRYTMLESDGTMHAIQHPGWPGRDYAGGRNEFADLLRQDLYINLGTVLFRRETLALRPAFFDDTLRAVPEERFFRATDWDLMLDLSRRDVQGAFVNEAMSVFRVHVAQASSGLKYVASGLSVLEHGHVLLRYAVTANLLRIGAALPEIVALYMGRYEHYLQHRDPSATERHAVVLKNHESVLAALRDLSGASLMQPTLGGVRPAPSSAIPAVQSQGAEYAHGLDLSRHADRPFFTVIVTTYDRPRLLVDALASIRAQTFTDYEVVLVNDHGDPVDAVVAGAGLPVQSLRLARNSGQSAARNAALRLAAGRYICFLDDDDCMLPGHLQVLHDAAVQAPGEAVYTDACCIIERLEDGRRAEIRRETPYLHGDFSLARLYVGNYIPVNTVAVPAEALRTVDGFDTTLAGLEDWELLLRLARIVPFRHVPQVSVEVRIREAVDNVSRRQRPQFPALFRRIYAAHGEPEHLTDAVVQGRALALRCLDAEAEAVQQMTPVEPLRAWLDAQVPTQSRGRLIDEYLTAHDGGPGFTIFVRDLAGDQEKLVQTLASLTYGECLYANIGIVVLTTRAAGGTTAGDKLHLVQVEATRYVDVLNMLMLQSAHDWVLVADAGDVFTRDGLLKVALELMQLPECRAVYADEIRRLPDGGLGAAFRPGFNLDLLLSQPAAMARHWIVQREVLVQAGGYDPAFADALEFELITRLIDSGGLDGLAHVDEALMTTDAPVLQDSPAERLVLERHLARRGYEAATVESSLPGRYRIQYGHTAQPLVSIIIPTRDQLPMLQRCVESLLATTRYRHYEVLIVDNASEDDDALRWLDGVEAMGSDQVRILRYPHPFNYSAINNLAARAARGEYLVLLNNDTAIVREDWLEALLNHALRPEVGIVGAKLFYPNGTIQHAGVLLGLRGPANHPFHAEPMEAAGYMNRLQVDQDYSAVTGACLMVRKSVYDEVGGLDEEAFQVSYNDVDLCLKVRAAGHLVVWSPHAVVMHEGSVSQTQMDAASTDAKAARFGMEQETMYARWLPFLARDPAYNRHLTLDGPGFELEPDPALAWRPLPWHPVPTALVFPADRFGCGHYRMIKPFETMKEQGLLDGMLSGHFLSPVQMERYDTDTLVFQRQLEPHQLENMKLVKAFSRSFKIYELDDYLPNLPVKSVHKRDIGQDVIKVLRRGLSYVDRFVVSTEELAESFRGLHPDIRVVQNRLPPVWWRGLQSRRRRGHKPRVGWAGGMGHTGDLELIAGVVEALATEVEWVFFGLCPDRIRPFVHEVHAGVPIDDYPAALAALDLDLALAPLEQNRFNECKSTLRLLEYGACGVPVVCSDIACYRNALPVTRVKNRFKDWVDAVRMHIHDLDAAARAGDALRAEVLRDWMLEGEHLRAWRDAWTGR
ncbi:glycosyltransferase [uncultured Xylophilus sp.]|uniref:glycosyltransferase n=1 Tax=uncultured Xylophilus sp. TaxID=296832 RepID=UPI0025DDEB1D|nr:glycosyltransferase [uncultured Xylophilus sp.]